MDKNLSAFKQEFVAAGCRNNIVGLYKMFLEHGANTVNKDNDELLLSSKTEIVLLCKNGGIRKAMPMVQLLKKTWWNYYHNRKIVRKPGLRTFNVPKQTSKILDEVAIFTPIEELIPE